MSYLGIDLGTSGLRALLIHEDGTIIGSAQSAYPVNNKNPGWSEQDPALWIKALDVALHALKMAHPEFAKIAGIGVAGHMHGAVMLDAAGAVLHPCLLWNDTRAEVEARRLDADPQFQNITGNIVFPGFTAPKLAWMKHHLPDVFAQTAKVLLPAAYLNHYLSGEFVSDMSDASGTAWLDVSARAWSPSLLAATDLGPSHMPRLVEGCAAAGTLRSELAARWGLSSDVVIAGGAGDNMAAASGVGTLNDGQGFVSLGTSGVVLMARDSFQPAPQSALHMFCHAVPHCWVQMGVILAATDSLEWLARITQRSAQDLTDALGTKLKGPSSLRFYPYLSGERTPHNDARIRGGFSGISQQTDVAQMTQAVLEGVAFALKDSLAAIQKTGAKPESLFVVGGGARSDYWVQLLATVFDLPLLRPCDGEFGAALGAARLGQAAATGANPLDIMTPPEHCETFEPSESLRAPFAAAYQVFRSNFLSLKAMQS